MEGQITLNEWMQWKEDIRRKLQETASNFVYIGYRLKQIRDSGMYDGCANIFEFAEKEYHLERTTVSRFMSINDKFSKHGNSIELRDEFVGLGQSQLSEMLSLPVNDYDLITEDTAIKDIRELKRFEKDAMNEPVEENGTEDTENEAAMQTAESPDSGNEEQSGTEEEKAAKEKKEEYTPLQRCIIDFFKDRQELLLKVLEIIDREDDEGGKEIAELLSPTGSATHRKGIVFLLMYDYKGGVKYKIMGQPDPVSMTWEKFIAEIDNIFIEGQTWNIENKIKEIYPETVQKEPEIVQKPQKTEIKPQKTEDIVKEPQRSEPVATSQQEEKRKEDTIEEEPKEEASPATEETTVPAAEEVQPATEKSQPAAEADEIRQAYHKTFRLIREIEKYLGEREWGKAYTGADVLAVTIEWISAQAQEQVNEALDAEFDNE